METLNEIISLYSDYDVALMLEKKKKTERSKSDFTVKLQGFCF